MNWLFQSIIWYIVLLFLSIGFLPITKSFFGKRFLDYGYPFARVFGILAITYGIFIFSTLKILPYTRPVLFILFILFCVLNVYIARRDKFKLILNDKKRLAILVFEELLFLIAFLFWTFIRGQEPSAHGLEKFMDFGFINSILKTTHFPPLDMWLSSDPGQPQGYPINYYYFGHLVGATLIKLSGLASAVGYNLILATIFALSVSQTFSIVINSIYLHAQNIKKVVNTGADYMKIAFYGLIGAFILNLGGNLHTIYLFTKGYPNESPVPFWTIMSTYNPTSYWYPNATRFIPFTIHEFPSYSWVVADLHGHVFDIPFVLLTLIILLSLFLRKKELIKQHSFLKPTFLLQHVVLIGFLTAIHYMTNAFDGLIYLLLSGIILFFIFRFSKFFVYSITTIIGGFILFSLPFSLYFKPFVSGIGVNCSPDFLVRIAKLGPFLFEKGNCQISPPWMLFILWGFFVISFVLFLLIKLREKIEHTDIYMFILFVFGLFLILIPEFFYIKDIYPAHFRANTMFKLGYQAFMMMSIASTYTFYLIKSLPYPRKIVFAVIFIVPLFLVAIYPVFSIPSYYGQLNRPVELDGSKWLLTDYPEDKEIIDYINRVIVEQRVVLEAQGDSYTDYNRISAYTGMPTVAGWWVHEWLWRGSSEVVGSRAPEIATIYETDDLTITRQLLKKYNIHYVIISSLERKKYPNIKEAKFSQIGQKIFTSSNKSGAVYQVDNY